MSSAPDYAAPLVAWRVWQAEAVDGAMRLVSVYHSVKWPVRRPLEAACLKTRPPWSRAHQSPLRRCRCGIYATKLAVMRSHLMGESVGDGTPTVVGCVSLWGDILECERGWRASRAYPERLYVPAFHRRGITSTKLAADLGAYGVPVAMLASSTMNDAIDEISRLGELALPA